MSQRAEQNVNEEDIGHESGQDEAAAEVNAVDSIEENDSEEPDNSADSGSQALTEEQLARRRGWKPRSEWVGDVPDNFVDDPARFNEEHERINPRLRSEVKRLNDEISRFEERFNRAIEAQNRRHQEELRREKDRLYREMRDAAEQADTDRFDAARKDLDILEAASTKQAESQPKSNGYDPNNDPNFRAWHTENSWYHQDAARTKYAERVAAQEVAARGLSPQKDGRAFYDAITAMVDHAFGKPTKGAPSVDNSSQVRSSAAVPKKRGFDHLPSEVKSDFKWMVQRGIFKNDQKSRESYAAQIYAENPDLGKRG